VDKHRGDTKKSTISEEEKEKEKEKEKKSKLEC